jgi:hypothetical protein
VVPDNYLAHAVQFKEGALMNLGFPRVVHTQYDSLMKGQGRLAGLSLSISQTLPWIGTGFGVRTEGFNHGQGPAKSCPAFT